MVNDDPTYSLKHFLRLRGVQDPCPKCKGLGSYNYPSGATWRGGMGTCAFQHDICDQCWGTGDVHRIGTDIRKLEAERKSWEENQVLEYLAHRLGCGIPRIAKRIQQLADLCIKQSNKRKLPEGESEFWWNHEWDALGQMLLRLIEGKEIK